MAPSRIHTAVTPALSWDNVTCAAAYVPACWVHHVSALEPSAVGTPKSMRYRTAAAASLEQNTQPLHEGEREERESH